MRQANVNRRIFLACALLAASAAFTPAWAQLPKPLLRVEAGTHNARVWGIAADPSGRILVSGSEDKTVRVWDIPGGGQLLRTLRPPAGEGQEGQIYAVAVSPDARTVVCGGITGSGQKSGACLYLFDLATGALTRRLVGLPGYVQHLAYTPDGRFLAVVMGKGGMRVYRLPDYVPVAEDKDYKDLAKWVESDPAGSRLATACWDGFIRLYDLSALKFTNASLPQALAPVSKIRPKGGQRPWGLAFSPNGARLAVGQQYNPNVDVLEVKGNSLEQAYSPDTSGIRGPTGTDLRAVAWSSDGRFLYAGGYYVFRELQQVRKWADGGRGPYKDLAMRNDLTFFQLLSLRSGGIAYCAADGSVGMLGDRDAIVLMGTRILPVFAGNAENFLLSTDGSAILFAYQRGGKSPALFSVSDRRLEEVPSGSRAEMSAGLTLQPPVTSGLGLSDWKGSMTPKLDGKPLPLRNVVSQSLAIKPDRSGFLLGTSFTLHLFDSAGKESWRLKSPNATLAVNTNSQVAVAAHADGTIRWYRLSDGNELLAFFPHADRKRWVLWTPSGYYDASPGGEEFIGWHVDNGTDSTADFFPISRFRSTYYRPDVIDRVLNTLDEKEALRLANDESGRKQTAEVSVWEKLPPAVTISSPADGAEVSGTPVKLLYAARSPQPLTGLRVLVDGRPVSIAGAGGEVKESAEISVPIPPRDCEVSVIAENRHGAGEPAAVRLRWKGAAAAREEFRIKPKLYVLAVGISQYQDAELRLDLAAKDALDFGSAWTEQRGRMYSGVEVRSLTDAQATKGNILDGLEWLQRQVTQKDVAVLFFAGHGINDPNGVFYFLPVDADPERLKRTGISQSDITSTVATIPGKVLVFMDACHSGSLMSKARRRGVVVTSAVVNELASAENGAVVFSSSTGRQYSQENPEWGNGAFTKGVVEGLRGKADFKSTGRITLNMLDLYVSERVKELTKGQQTPSTVKPPNVSDFPIAVLR